MRNASGHQCKERMSGSEKKCLEVSRCSRAKQRQSVNVQTKCAARAKLLFCKSNLLSF